MDLGTDIKPIVLDDDSGVRVKEEEIDLDVDIKPAVFVDDVAVKEEEDNELPTQAGPSSESVMRPTEKNCAKSARTFPILDIDIKPIVLDDDSGVRVKEEEREELDVDIKPAVFVEDCVVKEEERNELPTDMGRSAESVMCPGDENCAESARTFPNKRQMMRERNLKETIKQEPSAERDRDELRQRVLTIARLFQHPFCTIQFGQQYKKAFGCSDIPTEMLGFGKMTLGKLFEYFNEIRHYSKRSYIYAGSDAFDGFIHTDEVASIQRNVTDLMSELQKNMSTVAIWSTYREKYGEPTALQELERGEFRFQHFLLIHPELKHMKHRKNLVFSLRTAADNGASTSGEFDEGRWEFTTPHEKIADLMKTFEEPVSVGVICSAYEKKYGVPLAPKKCHTRHKLNMFFKQHPMLKCIPTACGPHFKLKEDHRPDEEMKNGTSSSMDWKEQEEEKENSSSRLCNEFINKVRAVAKDFPHRFNEQKLLKAFSCRYPSSKLLVDAKKFGYDSLLKLVAVIPEIRTTKNGGAFFWVGESSETDKRQELKELQKEIMSIVQGMKSIGVMQINQEYFKTHGQYVPYHKFGYKNVRRCLLGMPELKSQLKEQSVERSKVPYSGPRVEKRKRSKGIKQQQEEVN